MQSLILPSPTLPHVSLYNIRFSPSGSYLSAHKHTVITSILERRKEGRWRKEERKESPDLISPHSSSPFLFSFTVKTPPYRLFDSLSSYSCWPVCSQSFTPTVIPKLPLPIAKRRNQLSNLNSLNHRDTLDHFLLLEMLSLKAHSPLFSSTSPPSLSQPPFVLPSPPLSLANI